MKTNRKGRRVVAAMVFSDEELLVLKKSLDNNPWVPSNGYGIYKALGKRIDAEVERRGLIVSKETNR